MAERPAQPGQMQIFDRLSAGILSSTSRGNFSPWHQQALTDLPSAIAQSLSAPQIGHVFSSDMDLVSLTTQSRRA